MEKIRLSPTSGLALFLECPRCFWLRYNEGVHRPEAVFPSLPGGMDRIIKSYFDSFRKIGKLPPELEEKVVGKLMPNQELLDEWRNWRKGLTYDDQPLGATLTGALDDCLVDENYYIPVDFKTRGSAPKEGDSEEYYQTQLDTYVFLLQKNGYQTKEFAYLVYYYPEGIVENHLIKFKVEVVRVETDSQRCYRIFQDAVNCLKGPIPKAHTDCNYCAWFTDLLDYD
ncbi:MAG: PD-(D/E)XK nuclease family protein [Candidatus Margulisiibacteriota bacterium]